MKTLSEFLEVAEGVKFKFEGIDMVHRIMGNKLFYVGELSRGNGLNLVVQLGMLLIEKSQSIQWSDAEPTLIEDIYK